MESPSSHLGGFDGLDRLNAGESGPGTFGFVWRLCRALALDH